MNSEKDKLANIMPQGYEGWRKEMEKLIERSKLTAVMNVNAEMLSLYWKIGHDIRLSTLSVSGDSARRF